MKMTKRFRPIVRALHWITPRAEWFCLADARKNFLIDPVRDQEYLFGEPEWESEIDGRHIG